MIAAIFTVGPLIVFTIAMIIMMIKTKRLIYCWFIVQSIFIFVGLVYAAKFHLFVVDEVVSDVRPPGDSINYLTTAILFWIASLVSCLLGIVFVTFYRKN